MCGKRVGLVTGNKKNSISFSTCCSYYTSLNLFLNLESDIYFPKSHHFWAAQPFAESRGLWGSGILYLVHLFGCLAFSPLRCYFSYKSPVFLIRLQAPQGQNKKTFDSTLAHSTESCLWINILPISWMNKGKSKVYFKTSGATKSLKIVVGRSHIIM